MLLDLQTQELYVGVDKDIQGDNHQNSSVPSETCRRFQPNQADPRVGARLLGLVGPSVICLHEPE